MGELVHATMDSLGPKNLFNQAGLAFLRDAWIAAEFGSLRNADKIRLVADIWPDFELFVDNCSEAFEAVEADDPKRQRGVEYRDRIGEVEDDPVEDWVRRAEQAPAWLEAACQKKAGKHYAGSVSLVIHLNMHEFDIRRSEVEACFPSATESVKDIFDAVWVLWKKQAYKVWSRL